MGKVNPFPGQAWALLAILGSFTRDTSNGNLGRHPNGLFCWRPADVVATEGELKEQESLGWGRSVRDCRAALDCWGDTRGIREK